MRRLVRDLARERHQQCGLSGRRVGDGRDEASGRIGRRTTRQRLGSHRPGSPRCCRARLRRAAVRRDAWRYSVRPLQHGRAARAAEAVAARRHSNGDGLSLGPSAVGAAGTRCERRLCRRLASGHRGRRYRGCTDRRCGRSTAPRFHAVDCRLPGRTIGFGPVLNPPQSSRNHGPRDTAFAIKPAMVDTRFLVAWSRYSQP